MSPEDTKLLEAIRRLEQTLEAGDQLQFYKRVNGEMTGQIYQAKAGRRTKRLTAMGDTLTEVIEQLAEQESKPL